MYKPSSNSRQASLFWDLETMLDSKHPLFKLANMVDWSLFENSFAPLFCADNGPSQANPTDDRLAYAKASSQCIRRTGDSSVCKERLTNVANLTE